MTEPDEPINIKNEPFEAADELIIPLAEETLNINKEMVLKGKLFVDRKTETKTVPITQKLLSHTARVQHVPIEKYVDEIPLQRTEAGVTIIPVYEEHIEIIKRIYLKEEVRIESQEEVLNYETEETLRYQTISLNRTSIDE